MLPPSLPNINAFLIFWRKQVIMLAAQGKDGVPATGKYRDESITLQVRNTIKDTFNLLSKECPIPIIIKTLKNFSTPERRNSLSISGSVHVSRIVLMKRIAGKKPIENWPMQKFLLFFPIRRP